MKKLNESLVYWSRFPLLAFENFKIPEISVADNFLFILIILFIITQLYKIRKLNLIKLTKRFNLLIFFLLIPEIY